MSGAPLGPFDAGSVGGGARFDVVAGALVRSAVTAPLGCRRGGLALDAMVGPASCSGAGSLARSSSDDDPASTFDPDGDGDGAGAFVTSTDPGTT